MDNFELIMNALDNLLVRCENYDPQKVKLEHEEKQERIIESLIETTEQQQIIINRLVELVKQIQQ